MPITKVSFHEKRSVEVSYKMKDDEAARDALHMEANAADAANQMVVDAFGFEGDVFSSMGALAVDDIMDEEPLTEALGR